MIPLGGMRNFLLKFKYNSTIIDNPAFRLHYRYTVLILVAFILVASSREFLGEPIQCMTTDTGIPVDLLNQLCWIQSTYSIPEFWHKQVGKDVPYHGIGLYKDGMQRVHYKHYQWVVFMLFFQTICFYVPRFIWKMWEGGKVRLLVLELDKPCLDAKEQTQRVLMLADFLRNSKGMQNMYATSYIICEMLNFVNVVAQMFLTDKFLGHQFTKFGIDVLKFVAMNEENRTDPMIMVFPRITMCDFYRYGYGATIERVSAMCVLPLNIVNEKIYIFLWFWFVLLIAVSFFGIIFRIFTKTCFKLRCFLIRIKAWHVPENALGEVVLRLDYGDWFLLMMLCKNIDQMNLKALFEAMRKAPAAVNKL